MDPVTGNDVEGITITRSADAESHVSTCAGVTFSALPGSQNYGTPADFGGDCGTLTTHAYLASPSNASGPGTLNITLSRNPNFLSDTLTGTAGTNLADHSPEIGGTWVPDDDPLTPVLELDGAGNVAAISPGAQNGWTYHNDAAPPSADYTVIAILTRVAAGLAFPAPGIRDDGTGNMYQAFYNDSSNQWQLRLKIGAAFTNLGAAIPDTIAIGDNRQCNLTTLGSDITMDIPTVGSVTVSNGVISAAGFPAICYETNAGPGVGVQFNVIQARP